MRIWKKMKGITLISLIVTIIILLILAGISIQLIGGSNGILNRASQALDTNDKASATEKMELKITYLNMVSYGENTRKATLQELADGLFADKEVEYVKLKNQEIASMEPIDVTGENSFFVKLKEYPYEFEIDENLQLASVDGVKMETTTSEIEELKTKIGELEEENSSLKSQIADLQGKESELNNLKAILAQADATANDILSGKKAYTQSGLITGILENEINIVSYKENVSCGTTINVNIGDYVFVSSLGATKATNAETIVNSLNGGVYGGVGAYTSIFKATASTMKITPGNNVNFSYIIVK